MNERYFKWVAGDDTGVLEKLDRQDDEYYYFESGNRCSIELMEDYMTETHAGDIGIEKPKYNPIINVSTNNVQQEQYNTNIGRNIEKDVSNYNKILKLSDVETHSLIIETPDKKTIAIMQMSGIDLHQVLTNIYINKLNDKIKEILNEEDNYTTEQQ